MAHWSCCLAARPFRVRDAWSSHALSASHNAHYAMNCIGTPAERQRRKATGAYPLYCKEESQPAAGTKQALYSKACFVMRKASSPDEARCSNGRSNEKGESRSERAFGCRKGGRIRKFATASVRARGAAMKREQGADMAEDGQVRAKTNGCLFKRTEPLRGLVGGGSE